MCLLPYTTPAAQEWLVPVQTATPVYPARLLGAHYTGKVRARLTVEPEGSIADVQIIESMHPALAESVLHALAQWRFRPWKSASGARGPMTITLPVIFGSPGNAPFDSHVSVGLGNIRCAYVNHEVLAQQRYFPDAPLGHVDVFWYTGQFLHSDYAALQRSETERKALLRQRDSALPAIVKRCAKHPRSRYGDHLPVRIRQLLVAVDETA
ncbi:energy transducer TonB [Pseudomonas syringae]|nr:energy transducer TonB [Pseudomonas syringae]